MFTSFSTCITGYNNFKVIARTYMTKARMGQPNEAVNDKTVNILRALLAKDRRCTLNDLHHTIATDYSYMKCSRASVANILHDELKMQKVSAHWVPRQLLETHLDQQRTVALTFFTLYQEQGNLLLNQIVTRDESWVHYWTAELKLASTQWKGKEEPSPLKFKCVPSA